MMHISMVHIGEQLKNLRLVRTMTQRQLAKAAGLSERAVVQLEANRVEPRPSTIRKLADALEVSPEQLLFGKKT